MTVSLLRLLATGAACLFSLASANVTMAANLATNHGGNAAPAATTSEALPDPGDLTEYRGKVGQTFRFTVTGTTDGSIYGEGVYTDDSPLATAAVHAGVLSPGQTKDLQVEIMPGQSSYKAAFDFGVTSSEYGAWKGSYRFLDTPMKEAEMVFPDPGNLKAYESKVGKTLQFQVRGSTTESVWGDGIYTDDSDLDTAAVHVGLLEDGEDANVMVKILPGQGKYAGKTRNGIESGSYGKFSGSYEFLDPETREPIKPTN